jgi:diguanylate cyclase (GGDEF)-like protein
MTKPTTSGVILDTSRTQRAGPDTPKTSEESRAPSLIGRVADTTEQWDREALDDSTVSLLQEFLDARSVALYRLIEHEGAVYVALRAAAARGGARTAAAMTSDPTSLPPVRQKSEWQQCVSRRSLVQARRVPDGQTSVFPIEDREKVVGLLEVQTDALIQVRDTTLVQGMLRILRNQLALLDYGERDTLTGLLNRKTFEARIHRRSADRRSVPPPQPTASEKFRWQGLLDIDHFKSINDKYGHIIGDEVLLLVSQIMKQTFRGADELFRFGGEEFVILLQPVDEAGARVAFERLRWAVEGHQFPQSGKVTVSIGYTRLAEGDVSSTTVVARADAALYYAKRNGRNVVWCYETLVESGDLKPEKKEGDVELF